MAREDGEAGQAPVLDKGRASGAECRQTQCRKEKRKPLAMAGLVPVLLCALYNRSSPLSLIPHL